MSERPDRRQAVRWKAQVECRFECQGQSHQGLLFDLSEKGAYVQSHLALPDARIPVTIHFRSLDGQRDLSMAAVVRHRRTDAQGNPEGFGVEFKPLSEEALTELEAIVTQPTFLKDRKG